MNGSPTPPPVPLAPDFKDRRTGLIIFGILEIVLGALAALMIPLMILGQAMAAQTNHEPMASAKAPTSQAAKTKPACNVLQWVQNLAAHIHREAPGWPMEFKEQLAGALRQIADALGPKSPERKTSQFKQRFPGDTTTMIGTRNDNEPNDLDQGAEVD